MTESHPDGPQADGIEIRPIRAGDDAAMARVIREVMTEMGASGPGFAIHDAEVDALSVAYSGPRSAYWVVVDDEGLAGGGGFAPLAGGDGGTCELRKMYYLPRLRGRGLGRRLIETILAAAAQAGYRRCYLETLASMSRARVLYEAQGFRKLCRPEGATGHFGCDSWYELLLAPKDPA